MRGGLQELKRAILPDKGTAVSTGHTRLGSLMGRGALRPGKIRETKSCTTNGGASGYDPSYASESLAPSPVSTLPLYLQPSAKTISGAVRLPRTLPVSHRRIVFSPCREPSTKPPI